MKNLFTLATLSAVALVLPTVVFAAPKKEAAAPPAEMKKAVTKPAAAAADAVKGRGFATKIDSIDPSAKTLSYARPDKSVVKLIVTATTEIKNGDVAAKFEDIKVGDTVSGSRLKKSETEYELVKITKFGVAAPRVKQPKAEDAPEKDMKKAMKKAE